MLVKYLLTKLHEIQIKMLLNLIFMRLKMMNNLFFVKINSGNSVYFKGRNFRVFAIFGTIPESLFPRNICDL